MKITPIMRTTLRAALTVLAEHGISPSGVSADAWSGEFTEPEDDPLAPEAAHAIGVIAGVALAFNVSPMKIAREVTP